MRGSEPGTDLVGVAFTDALVCHVWTLRDGKITKFQQYVDTAKLQHTMGAGVS